MLLIKLSRRKAVQYVMDIGNHVYEKPLDINFDYPFMPREKLSEITSNFNTWINVIKVAFDPNNLSYGMVYKPPDKDLFPKKTQYNE
jgi:hypothetical protein